MAHIDLGLNEQEFPGITGLLRFRPETGQPLGQLADALLRGENSLSPGERELIAAYVSGRNDCQFCSASHSAAAAVQLDAGMPLVEQAKADPDGAPISEKLRALLHIAGAVQQSGRAVTPALVESARQAGASDVEIHDAVLIAAAFCMFNRYVDGLGTLAPDDGPRYLQAAQHIVQHGYGRALVG